jgi:hypothetical protein
MRLEKDKDGRGRYAIVKLRKTPDDPGKRTDVQFALECLDRNGMIDYGKPGDRDEFFVIYLRDQNASVALREYAANAWLYGKDEDEEYYRDVAELAKRAAESPFRKKPD